jgi:heterodisulfide reductase subunit A
VKKTLYFCRCGSEVTSRIDETRVAEASARRARVTGRDFLCSEDGQQWMRADLAAHPTDRVVVAACSPRDHECTFQRVLADVGMNPYFMQMVNIREQVAWVTPDRDQATAKAIHLIDAALARVGQQQPLESRQVPASTAALVIGAGPAGLKCALALAEAGRQVTVVERTAVPGGMPVLFEELFPDMECGPCLLEPLMGKVMHGERIQLLTLSEVSAVSGYQGNFEVTVQSRPRYVDPDACIGCTACVDACPESLPNPFDEGLSQRKAIAYAFAGALPNAPFLEMDACLRSRGENCQLCLDACPVPGAVVLDDQPRSATLQVGAIIVATGSSLYDVSLVTELGYKKVPGVYTSVEFERILASNGPCGACLTRPDTGAVPQTVALIHCAGSLDPRHVPYCSSVCCAAAFKVSQLATHHQPGTRFIHLHKDLVLPGKQHFAMFQRAKFNSDVELRRYNRIESITATASGGQLITAVASDGSHFTLETDMVVLFAALAPPKGAVELARLLDAGLDEHGFFEELHGRIDASRSKVQGIYLAGTCQGPMDIQGASSQGMAAAGHALSALVEGRMIEVSPVKAVVDEQVCSSCRICATVCPYHAIRTRDERGAAWVNDVLCHGCGTCVAACPSGAIAGPHFTGAQIMAELEGLLR